MDRRESAKHQRGLRRSARLLNSVVNIFAAVAIGVVGVVSFPATSAMSQQFSLRNYVGSALLSSLTHRAYDQHRCVGDKNALDQCVTNQPDVMGMVSPRVLRSPSVGSFSQDWAGYVAPTQRPATSIQAAWKVPAVNCTITPNGRLNVWVGVGGAHPYPFPQAGTDSTCVGGHATYDYWCSQHSFATNSQVSSGDAMLARVWKARGHWYCQVTDETTHSSSPAAKLDYEYSGSSNQLDFVAERITASGGLADLAAFGNVTFTKMSSTPQVSFTNKHYVATMVFNLHDPTASAIASASLDPLVVSYVPYNVFGQRLLQDETACGGDSTIRGTVAFADKVSCQRGLQIVNDFSNTGDVKAGWSCQGASGPGFIIMCREGGNPNLPNFFTAVSAEIPHIRVIDSTSAGSGSSKPSYFVANNVGSYVMHPTSWTVVTFPSEGYAYQFSGLTWQNWGTPTAIGNGQLTLCTEQLTECHSGTVTLELNHAQPGNGRYEYCWMSITASSVPDMPAGLAGNPGAPDAACGMKTW